MMNFIIAVRAHQDADPEIAALADNLKVSHSDTMLARPGMILPSCHMLDRSVPS